MSKHTEKLLQEAAIAKGAAPQDIFDRALAQAKSPAPSFQELELQIKEARRKQCAAVGHDWRIPVFGDCSRGVATHVLDKKIITCDRCEAVGQTSVAVALVKWDSVASAYIASDAP
jgi:hypothetical protein